MDRLEKAIDSKIKKWCDKNGVLWIKFTPMGSRGWPDRIAVFRGGFHLWVELKRPGKIPTKLQQHRMADLIAKGALTAWFDNAEDCIEYLQDCLDAAIEAAAEQEGVVVAKIDKPVYPY